ncbi:MAG: hypothetical protein XD78_2240 [Desulfotomaculum sp. 46_296]|nr:MAG: hypothetical protein XD78_2240 [Desulfotomaculum sp. 46_296]
MMELERENNLNPKALLNRLSKEEIKPITILGFVSLSLLFNHNNFFRGMIKSYI